MGGLSGNSGKILAVGSMGSGVGVGTVGSGSSCRIWVRIRVGFRLGSG